MRKLGLLGLFGIVACATLVSGEGEALACGGCFHPEPTPQQPLVESSVVNDHRMVFALAPQQTVLWDQIRYDGDPREFVWVLPVLPGTKIELSRDEWIAALDGTTQTQIIQPRSQLGGFGGGGRSFGGGGDGNGGCGCGTLSSADSTSAQAGDPGSGSSADAGVAPPPDVQVVSQEVVGPYETVIVRSEKPKAMELWLREHGYAIPASIVPVIEAYTAEHLDFVALRLRPGQGVRAMRPVRIVSPGADPTLPLRMVAAGVGARVGLTLYVISEGRYRPQNFPEGQIDEKKLVWDPQASRSNYTTLAAAVLAGGEGRTWLTEFAGKPVTIGGAPRPGNATLFDAYYGACQGRSALNEPPPPPPLDAGTDGGADGGDTDGGEADAGDVDAGESDGGTPGNDGGVATNDGGPAPSAPSQLCEMGTELCCEFDDLEVAVGSMHRSDVWITRLRADLPVSALSQDLRLEAHPNQVAVSNVHNAVLPTGSTARIAPVRSTHLGAGLAMMATALLVGRAARRRARARARDDQDNAPRS